MTSSLNILVAEDSRLNQVLATRLLEQAGHTVTLASNGREAVIAVRRDDYDLVLMDVEMPEMNGLDATTAIRSKEQNGRRVPIVAVTATGDPTACLAAGMDEWLPKPLSMSKLNRALEKVCGRTAA
jgi:CheY-like chemotaxis protein